MPEAAPSNGKTADHVPVLGQRVGNDRLNIQDELTELQRTDFLPPVELKRDADQIGNRIRELFGERRRVVRCRRRYREAGCCAGSCRISYSSVMAVKTDKRPAGRARGTWSPTRRSRCALST